LMRADAVITRLYAGARDDLARLRASALTRRPPHTRGAGLTCAIEALLQHALGAPNALAVGRCDAACVQALDIADTLTRDGAIAHDSAAAASRICELLAGAAWSRRAHRRKPAAVHGIATEPPDAPNASGSTDAPAHLQVATSSARACAQQHGGGPLAHDDLTGWTMTWPTADALRRVAQPARRAPMSPVVAAMGSDDAPDAIGRRHLIDEWDCHLQQHRRDWCTLHEQRQRGDDAAFIHRVRRRHATLRRDVHRRFAALRPEALQRVHGAPDGDELEIERVIEAVLDRRAGRTTDHAPYLRRDRLQRDVSAVFLVDTSASTDYVLRSSTPPPSPAASDAAAAAHDEAYLYDLQPAPAPAGQAPPRRVIDVAKDALALMCDALQALGDSFAVYAFSGHGRMQVDFRVVKDFSDAVSSRTAASLSALRPHGATRSGAAIRHATAKLARQPQRHKVLIVVSDGYPEDLDYGPEPRDLRYAIEDTAHALQEAEALGIETFNLSIDPAGHDYLRRMCPPQRYMVITDVTALPGELTKVYQAITRRAG